MIFMSGGDLDQKMRCQLILSLFYWEKSENSFRNGNDRPLKIRHRLNDVHESIINEEGK
jgi:hypothetical protein